VPFPIIVLGAGIIGLAGGFVQLKQFAGGGGHSAGKGEVLSDADSLLGESMPAHAQPSLGWAMKVGGICLALWLVPVFALLLTVGPDNVFSQAAVFFSKMAVVTFGGAYAVLAYVAQAAVDTYGWLRPGEMLDGLGMAETTPGPLIMVLQFVGFMGAFRNPGDLPPLLAGSLAGLLTTWVTFVPCFLWIFLGAPYVEALRTNRALSGALAAISASVVGVVLNLAVWFALHTIFGQVDEVNFGALRLHTPVPATLDLAALALSVAALILIFRFKVGMIPVLGGCAAAGIAVKALMGAL
jgi:chromate transporter